MRDPRLHRQRGHELDAVRRAPAPARCRRCRCRRAPCRSARPATRARPRCCTRARRPVGRSSRAQLGEHALERALLLHRCSRSPVRRRRRSACTRRRAAARRDRRRAPRGRRASSGSHPTRCMPVSIFRWTGSGSARRAVRDGLRQRVDAARGVHDGREPVRDDRLGRVRHRFRQHEDRRVDPGVAQLHALFDERDREARRRRPRPRPGRLAPRRGRTRRPSRPRTRAAGATTARNARTLARTASRSTSAHTGRKRVGHVVRAMNRTMSAARDDADDLAVRVDDRDAVDSAVVHDRRDVFERGVGGDRRRIQLHDVARRVEPAIFSSSCSRCFISPGHGHAEPRKLMNVGTWTRASDAIRSSSRRMPDQHALRHRRPAAIRRSCSASTSAARSTLSSGCSVDTRRRHHVTHERGMRHSVLPRIESGPQRLQRRVQRADEVGCDEVVAGARGVGRPAVHVRAGGGRVERRRTRRRAARR